MSFASNISNGKLFRSPNGTVVIKQRGMGKEVQLESDWQANREDELVWQVNSAETGLGNLCQFQTGVAEKPNDLLRILKYG